MKEDYKIFENIDIGVAVYEVKNNGEDFIIKDFNPNAYSITNLVGKDVIGKSVYKIFPGIKEMGLINVFIQVWETVISMKYAAKQYKDDKLLTYFENFVYRTKSGDIVTIFNDAMKETLLEKKINKSELKFRRLFETAQDGIILLDKKDGTITEVNPFLIKMLGYSHEEFLGKKIWEIGFLKDVIKNMENFIELKDKGYIRFEDLPLEASDKTKKHVEFISNVYDVGGEKIIQCNIRDITDRKLAEGKIKETAEATEKLNKIMMNRELKMAELKKENEELIAKCDNK